MRTIIKTFHDDIPQKFCSNTYFFPDKAFIPSSVVSPPFWSIPQWINYAYGRASICMELKSFCQRNIYLMSLFNGSKWCFSVKKSIHWHLWFDTRITFFWRLTTVTKTKTTTRATTLTTKTLYTTNRNIFLCLLKACCAHQKTTRDPFF